MAKTTRELDLRLIGQKRKLVAFFRIGMGKATWKKEPTLTSESWQVMIDKAHVDLYGFEDLAGVRLSAISAIPQGVLVTGYVVHVQK